MRSGARDAVKKRRLIRFYEWGVSALRAVDPNVYLPAEVNAGLERVQTRVRAYRLSIVDGKRIAT